MTQYAVEQRWRRERNWLGYAGLLPFLGSAAAGVAAHDSATVASATRGLLAYAAVIASFLGAVHWGVAAIDATSRNARLRWGVMPALLAWTLWLLPPGAALLGFAVLFAAILVVDSWLLPILDEGYRRLRLELSVVVVLCLLVAAPFAPEVPA